MTKPLISVVVPIYNVENYLKKCVDSILNQTYKNLEIILVDDGSPDKCPQICDEYAKNYNQIKVVHKKNGGLSDARNAGIKIATGKYISFIDSDDWIDNNMILALYNKIEYDNSDIVSCGVKWVYDSGKIIRDDKLNQDKCLNTECAMKELLVDGKLKQHVWNKLYKTELIKNIPFEKGKYHEDVFWSYQIIGIAKKVSILSESYYNYVQRENSIMGQFYSEKRLDALDACEKRCIYLKQNMPQLYDLSLYVYMGNCMYHLQQAIITKSDKKIKDNIIKRISFRKNGNVFKAVVGKQAKWLKLFFICPVFTCKIRNKLGIGM